MRREAEDSEFNEKLFALKTPKNLFLTQKFGRKNLKTPLIGSEIEFKQKSRLKKIRISHNH